jgi:hypothetical protein
VAPAIWTARLRTDRAAIFRASVSKAFRAAALIARAVEDSAVIALEEEVASAVIALEEVVALAVAALEEVALAVEAALADSAAAVAAGLGADDRNKDLESPILFSKT